jgi:hypothetical protein
MIGVEAREAEWPWVGEFFQLFKTPWEKSRTERRYGVNVVAQTCAASLQSGLTFVYSSHPHPIDAQLGVQVSRTADISELRSQDSKLPIYGGAATFSGCERLATLWADQMPAGYRSIVDGTVVVRFGYDLFREVKHLLTEGQPPENALVPTLELHIQQMRGYLQSEGASFIEVPPQPWECDFTCCLTHDIDFFGITRHHLDWTTAGFCARATAGTIVDTLRGRRTVDEALRNVAAAFALPFVHAGVLPDPWNPFRDYASADRGRPATFFVIPFKDNPGRAPDGGIPPRRAVAYDVNEISLEIAAATRPDIEFAVHGIDAWRDLNAGRAEIKALSAITGNAHLGVRMHWLYFADSSPHLLEQAGFAYDSTWGYNDSVGMRAGTMQPFQLAGTSGLLELPLAIMDTALFYPRRMGLTQEEARSYCQETLAAARKFGGALVVNWHDRSLAPERLWNRAYQALLDDIESAGRVWWANGADAVRWARWRRDIRFDCQTEMSGVILDGPALPEGLPPAQLKTHRGVETTSIPYSGGWDHLPQ